MGWVFPPRGDRVPGYPHVKTQAGGGFPHFVAVNFFVASREGCIVAARSGRGLEVTCHWIELRVLGVRFTVLQVVQVGVREVAPLDKSAVSRAY